MTLPVQRHSAPWWSPHHARVSTLIAYPAFAALVATFVVVALLPGLLAPSLDAAIFALAGNRVASGDLPYASVFDHKPPGIYIINALGDLIGGGLGAWPMSWVISAIAVTVTGVVVAGTLRDLGFRLSAWVSGAACAVLLASFPLALGGGMTESVAALPAAIGFRLAAVGPASPGRRLAAGLTAGVATAISLQVLPALVAVLVVAILRREHGGRARSPAGAIGWAVVGAALSWVAFVALLGSTGALPAAATALIRYNAAFSALAPLDDRIADHAVHAVVLLSPLLIAAAAGIRLQLARPALAAVGIGALVWVGSACAFVVFQGRLELHYIAPLAVPLAILVPAGVQLRQRRSVGFLGTASLVAALVAASAVSLTLIGGETSLAISARSGQAERTGRVAAWIQQHTGPDASMFVWGNAPDVYLGAQRAPASGYVYLLPLTTPGYVDDGLLANVVRDWEADPPTVIVDAGSSAPGVPGLPALLIPRPTLAVDGRNADLLDPLRAFVRERYALAETVAGWPVYVLR